MTETTLGKQYDEATRKYYGADKDPLKFVPVATDKEIAHGLALGVERQLSRMDEGELAVDALRVQTRSKHVPGETQDIDVIKNELMEHRLRNIVVNTEMAHAAVAPGNFNEDSEKAGAYEMGVGLILPNVPKPPEDL